MFITCIRRDVQSAIQVACLDLKGVNYVRRACLIVVRCKGYRILPHLFGDSLSAQPNVSGVFASDRSPTTPGFIDYLMRLIDDIIVVKLRLLISCYYFFSPLVQN